MTGHPDEALVIDLAAFASPLSSDLARAILTVLDASTDGAVRFEGAEEVAPNAAALLLGLPEPLVRSRIAAGRLRAWSASGETLIAIRDVLAHRVLMEREAAVMREMHAGLGEPGKA